MWFSFRLLSIWVQRYAQQNQRLAWSCLELWIFIIGSVRHRRKLLEDEDQNQKSSCIKDKAGEAFPVMTNLKYSALSIRAAEVRGPTVTAIPASRSKVRPLPLTREFGSVVQHTTLFT